MRSNYLQGNLMKTAVLAVTDSPPRSECGIRASTS